MSDAFHDPPRWKDRTDQANLTERSAGHAVRCARAVPSRSAPSLSRVAAGIRSSRPPMRLAWVVVTAALVLGLATAASAARLKLIPNWLIRIVQPQTSAPARDDAHSVRPKVRAAHPASSAKVPSPSTAGTAAPAEQVTSTPEAGAVAELAAPRSAPANRPEVHARAPKLALVERDESLRPSTRSRPSNATARSVAAFRSGGAMATNEPSQHAPDPWPSPPVAATAAPNSIPPVASTTRAGTPERTVPAAPAPRAQGGAGKYLTEAVRSLRVEHAPVSALRLLDSYDDELSKGGFGHEALILRVEALITLGRRAEVLRLLDGISLADVAASRALLVTRGELRAAASRCAEGIGDFDLVLARSRQSDRRALIGRALCRKQLGDAAGMRADIERLRREFSGQAIPGELAE